MWYLLTLALAFAPFTSGEKCCDNMCFALGGDYSHLPTPSCIEVRFGLFTKEQPKEATVLKSDLEIPTEFHPDRRVIFVIHGYHNSWETGYMEDIKDALIAKEDANVLLIDWKAGASKLFYPSSAANTRVVGGHVALLIERLVAEKGVKREKLWCIGFSLGAHACGFAGKLTEIERITGLDPAGPSFKGKSDNAKLDKNSAKFVDVIHTDGTDLVLFYGMLEPVGHMDFYPNKGKNQPGCLTNYPGDLDSNATLWNMDSSTYIFSWSMSCSHGRAATYFIDSIQNEHCFVARQICTDEKNLPKSCSAHDVTLMGYQADERIIPGKFYLETRSKQPHCLY